MNSIKAKDKHGMTLEWDRKAIEFLVNGYDINYGARSIKHEVERRVVNQIAVAHEYGLIENGSHILISADLPPNQQDELEIMKREDENKSRPKSAVYDIRLRKVVKIKENDVKYVDLDLKLNSFGKYTVKNN
jgi:hypothetical protein